MPIEDLSDPSAIAHRISALLTSRIGITLQLDLYPLIERETRLLATETARKAREGCVQAARGTYVYDDDVLVAKEKLIEAVRKAPVVRRYG